MFYLQTWCYMADCVVILKKICVRKFFNRASLQYGWTTFTDNMLLATAAMYGG